MSGPSSRKGSSRSDVSTISSRSSHSDQAGELVPVKSGCSEAVLPTNSNGQNGRNGVMPVNALAVVLGRQAGKLECMTSQLDLAMDGWTYWSDACMGAVIERGEMAAQYAGAAARAECKEAELDSVGSELRQTKGELSQTRSQLMRTTVGQSRAQAKLECTEEALRRVDTDKKKLKDEFHKKQNEFVEMSTQHAGTSARLECKEEELGRERSGRTKADKKLDRARNALCSGTRQLERAQVTSENYLQRLAEKNALCQEQDRELRQRRQLETELRVENARFRALLESSQGRVKELESEIRQQRAEIRQLRYGSVRRGSGFD